MPTLQLIYLCFFLSATRQFLLSEAYAVYEDQTEDNDVLTNGKLVFAHVIFRHGDRMIVDPYPNDPWGKPEYWPAGWGQLTNRGKRQHYELGKWLRKRYSDLLNETFSPDEIYIRSTDVDRTLMSALSNLAGLYPPKGNQIWNENLLWQPIPVHTVPEKMDNFLNSNAPCAAWEQAFHNLMKTQKFIDLQNHYKFLFDYLTQYSGRVVDTFMKASYMNNSFFIEELYDRQLPTWAKKIYPSADLTFVSNLAFSLSTYTRQMARLRIGPLMRDIFQRMIAKSKGVLQPDRAVWIYSGHDTNIANVLGALKLFELHSPPYTATILIELRVDAAKNYFVSVFYKNSTEARLLTIPNCAAACPLPTFLNLYKDIVPDDWQKECKVSTFSLSYEDANIGMAMAILCIFLITLLFVLCIGLIYYKRHSYKTIPYHSQIA